MQARFSIILAVAMLAAGTAAMSTANAVDLPKRDALRVCADPNNLPFSNDQGEGFENEIAQLLAARLGVPVRYTWHPQTMGFVRNTLRSYLCDVVMGVASANERVASCPNTRASSDPSFACAKASTHSPDWISR